MTVFNRTLRQMYRYRHLLYSLIVRALARKYYRTRMGFFWLILQPILTTLMYTIVFSVIIHVQIGAIPYPIFFLAGYLPWIYFSNVFISNSRIIITHSNFIEHYNFPHILLLCVALITELVEVAVGAAILIILILILGVPLANTFLLVIPVFAIQVLLLAGISLWMAPLIARFADLDLILQPFIRFFFHAIPVIYPLSAVPAYARSGYLLNPMSGLINGYRGLIFETISLSPIAIGWAILCTVVLLGTGIIFFQSQVKHFADIG